MAISLLDTRSGSPVCCPQRCDGESYIWDHGCCFYALRFLALALSGTTLVAPYGWTVTMRQGEWRQRWKHWGGDVALELLAAVGKSICHSCSSERMMATSTDWHRSSLRCVGVQKYRLLCGVRSWPWQKTLGASIMRRMCCIRRASFVLNQEFESTQRFSQDWSTLTFHYTVEWSCKKRL